MDTATQVLLGATVGQALGGRRLGRQAILWGALGGLLPDLDVASAVHPLGEMLYHRGPTHSLWFGLVVGPALGWWLWRRKGRRRPGALPAWIAVMAAALLTHPLLDLFTSYGTQLLAPFTRTRFALDAVAIVDPAYSVWLVVALVIGWRCGWGSAPGRNAAWVALVFSTVYLFYCWHLNHAAEARARATLNAAGIAAPAVRAYPTLLQPYLRRIVARQGDEVWVGWMSLWNGRQMDWKRFEVPADPLVDSLRRTEMGRVFEWFADGQTTGTVERTGHETVVVIDDLRYGVPAAPRQGLWAIRARFDASGRRLSEVERVRRRPPGTLLVYLRLIANSTFN